MTPHSHHSTRTCCHTITPVQSGTVPLTDPQYPMKSSSPSLDSADIPLVDTTHYRWCRPDHRGNVSPQSYQRTQLFSVRRARNGRTSSFATGQYVNSSSPPSDVVPIPNGSRSHHDQPPTSSPTRRRIGRTQPHRLRRPRVAAPKDKPPAATTVRSRRAAARRRRPAADAAPVALRRQPIYSSSDGVAPQAHDPLRGWKSCNWAWGRRGLVGHGISCRPTRFPTRGPRDPVRQRKIVHTAAAASATTTTHITTVRKCSLSARSCCMRLCVRFRRRSERIDEHRQPGADQ
ncbi:hypothetical protein RHA1_ro03571 [Rhodococcus jostii RHA1]|uniref:Uncharacterized protein n=1 Tax=Rhodococcus jostii (strain RHA1) TaxID=101510 RepID=Q0SAR2_RHOJR|nr:hypothetical protein RHA1_ro03571 [Rhodococcus jostii RHA1]